MSAFHPFLPFATPRRPSNVRNGWKADSYWPCSFTRSMATAASTIAAVAKAMV